MPLLLTQAEAADKLGTDREHIRELVRSGEIEIVAYRSRELIPAEELVRWVCENKRRSSLCQASSEGTEAAQFPAGRTDRASARSSRQPLPSENVRPWRQDTGSKKERDKGAKDEHAGP